MTLVDVFPFPLFRANAVIPAFRLGRIGLLSSAIVASAAAKQQPDDQRDEQEDQDELHWGLRLRVWR